MGQRARYHVLVESPSAAAGKGSPRMLCRWAQDPGDRPETKNFPYHGHSASPQDCRAAQTPGIAGGEAHREHQTEWLCARDNSAGSECLSEFAIASRYFGCSAFEQRL